MAYNFSSFLLRLKETENWLSGEYGQLHTGRATPLVLDSIAIDVYGSFQPIKNVASISIEDPKTLRVAPWDKSHIKEIEKAIQAANIGLSVASDDQGLRVIFPALTTENREKLVKVLKEKMEEARISVRKERETELKIIKDKELPEDEERRTKEELQRHVDAANLSLETLFAKKEKDIMQ